MNQEQKELLKEATAKNYFILENKVQYKVILTDFKMVRLPEKDKYGRDLQFVAKVICEDGTEKELNQSSTRFISAIEPFIIDKEPTDLVSVTIKKIGEGTNTQFDIEETK